MEDYEPVPLLVLFAFLLFLELGSLAFKSNDLNEKLVNIVGSDEKLVNIVVSEDTG